MKPTTILVAANHPLFRHGLVSILKRIPEFHIVGEASNIAETSAKVNSLHPDIVILGTNLSHGDIVNATSWIKQNCPVSKVIVLAESDNTDHISEVLEAGASGYLVKERLNIKNICESIKLASRSEYPVSAGLV